MLVVLQLNHTTIACFAVDVTDKLILGIKHPFSDKKKQICNFILELYIEIENGATSLPLPHSPNAIFDY
jgi:hypothetical protein